MIDDITMKYRARTARGLLLLSPAPVFMDRLGNLTSNKGGAAFEFCPCEINGKAMVLWGLHPKRGKRTVIVVEDY